MHREVPPLPQLGHGDGSELLGLVVQPEVAWTNSGTAALTWYIVLTTVGGKHVFDYM
jgi:hypothetical protein